MIMRWVKVLALLAALAAAAGAITGVTVAGILGLFSSGTRHFALSVFAATASFGATVGLLIGPATALLLLRRVPLWRATVETAAGATLGFVASTATSFPFGWIPLTLGGAALAALRLRMEYRHRGLGAPVPGDAERADVDSGRPG